MGLVVYPVASVPPSVSNVLILHKVIMAFQVRCKAARLQLCKKVVKEVIVCSTKAVITI